MNGLKEDEAIVSFIEAAHSSGETGTSIISNYTNETEFIVFEITLPVLALIVTVIALTVFWKYVFHRP